MAHYGPNHWNLRLNWHPNWLAAFVQRRRVHCAGCWRSWALRQNGTDCWTRGRGRSRRYWQIGCVTNWPSIWASTIEHLASVGYWPDLRNKFDDLSSFSAPEGFKFIRQCPRYQVHRNKKKFPSFAGGRRHQRRTSYIDHWPKATVRRRQGAIYFFCPCVCVCVRVCDNPFSFRGPSDVSRFRLWNDTLERWVAYAHLTGGRSRRLAHWNQEILFFLLYFFTHTDTQ